MAEEDKYDSIHPPEVVQMEHDNQPPSPLSDVPMTPISTVSRSKLSLVPELPDNDDTDGVKGPPRVSRKVTPPSAKNRQFPKLPSRITTQNQNVSPNEDEISPPKKKFFMKKTDAPFDENPIISPNMSSIERTLLRLKGQKIASSKVANQRKAKISPNMNSSIPSIDNPDDEIMGARKTESTVNENKSSNADNAPDDEEGGFLSKRNILAEMDEMEDFIIAAKSSEVSSPEKRESKEKPNKPMKGIPSEIVVDISPAASSDVGPRDETDEVMPRKSSKIVVTNTDKQAKIDEENDKIVEVTANVPSPSRNGIKKGSNTDSKERKLVDSSPENEAAIDKHDTGKSSKADNKVLKDTNIKGLGAVTIIDESKTNAVKEDKLKSAEGSKESELKITIKEGNIHISGNEKSVTQETDTRHNPESSTSEVRSNGPELSAPTGSNIGLANEPEDPDSSFEQEGLLEGVSLSTVLNDAAEAAASSFELFSTTLATSGQAVGEFVMGDEESSSAVSSPDRPKNPEEIAAEWRRRKREAVNQARLVRDSDSQTSSRVTDNVSFSAKSQEDDDMTEIADNLKDDSNNSQYIPSPIRMAALHESDDAPAAASANKVSSSGVTGFWLEKELERRDREQKVKAASQQKPDSATAHALVETSASENSAEPLSASSSQKLPELPVSPDDSSMPKEPEESNITEKTSPEEKKTKSEINLEPTSTDAAEELLNKTQEDRGDVNDTTKVVQGKTNEIERSEVNTIDKTNEIQLKNPRDIARDAIGKAALNAALSSESDVSNPDSSVTKPLEPAEEENVQLIEDSTTSDGKPALVRSLDDMDGICKGDLILSLLHTKGQDGKSSDSGATQIRNTLWRTRIMRRRFGLGMPNDSGSIPLVENSNFLAPRKQANRQSLPVDVDDVRTVSALNNIAALEKSALDHLRQDDFEGALDLYDDIFYAYTETYINQDKSASQEMADHEKQKSNIYLGNALHNLGIIHFLNQEYKDALSYFLRAEVKRAAPNGVPNSQHLTTLVKIAMCYYALEDFSKAHKGLELCLEGAKVHCKTMTDFIQIAEVLNNLGCLSFMCGQPDVSMKMFTESLDVQQSVLNNSLYGGSVLAGHTSSLNASVTQGNLAFIRMCMNDHSGALGLFEAALLTQQVLLYDAHETLLCTMDHLAAANLMHGSQQKAIHMLERMLLAQIILHGKHDARCEITRNKIVMARSKEDTSRNVRDESITNHEKTSELEGEYVSTNLHMNREDVKSNSFLDQKHTGMIKPPISENLQKRKDRENFRNVKEEPETEQLYKDIGIYSSQDQQRKPLMTKTWKKLGTSLRRSSKASI